MDPEAAHTRVQRRRSMMLKLLLGNREEEVDDEVTEQAEQWREQQEQVERSEVADTTEELKTISLELSSCVAPPFLPSPQQLPPSGDHGKTLTSRLLVKMLQAVRRA